jgi:hypothetical protein
MANVQHLRQQPTFSSWGGRPGTYYAEADRGKKVLGLCVERDGRRWSFEVVTALDAVIYSGDVRTLREAKSVLIATATRLIG